MDRQSIYGICIIILALCTACAFGTAVWYYQENTQLRQQIADSESTTAVSLPTPVAEVSMRPAVASDASEEVAALNAYIDKLEAANNAYKKQLESVGKQRANNRGDRRRPPNLEELKESNPEEYERIQARMEEHRKRDEERRQRRDDYLSNLDTSMLDDDQRAVIKDYQDSLKELEQAMSSGENRENMRELFGRVNSMRNSVREALYDQLSAQLGTDSESLTEGISRINEIVGGQGGPGGGPGGFGGGPGGPPPN
jgi:DNA repair exonuclease SbcCD ATPase subunit